MKINVTLLGCDGPNYYSGFASDLQFSVNPSLWPKVITLSEIMGNGEPLRQVSLCDSHAQYIQEGGVRNRFQITIWND